MGDLLVAAGRIESAYAELYDGALRPRGNPGEVTSIHKGKSDPTGNTALAPDARRLRGTARYVASRIRRALVALEEAERAEARAWQELPGGVYEDKPRPWQQHTWTDLPCGCASDNHGWWVVSRECSEHMLLIPLVDRVPFGEIVTAGVHRFGPFRPSALDQALDQLEEK